jgi:MerR family transcriptional regulator/heat shock protein HspR
MTELPAPSTQLLSIGEAAAALALSVPTLRMYEREGLLLPIRRPSGHRSYTRADLERVRCIRDTIRRDKVSIAGMRRMLALIPCWSVKRCPAEERDSCPAFTGSDRPCWSLPGKHAACAEEECRACAVYAEHADCHRIKRLITRTTTLPAGQGGAEAYQCSNTP